MFTGIVETMGEVQHISIEGSNRIFYLKSDLTSEINIDESICHNGVCLTVEEIKNDIYRVSAIEETLKKTNAGSWKIKDKVNLERSMKLNDRLDGHIVQGHIDATGICISKIEKKGSVEFTFQFDPSFAELLIEKGSICVNGVSLTAFNVTNENFTVAIIPYTFSHTNLQFLSEKDWVNLEFDVLGKYVQRIMQINRSRN
jgi:riboflavin synthase